MSDQGKTNGAVPEPTEEEIWKEFEDAEKATEPGNVAGNSESANDAFAEEPPAAPAQGSPAANRQAEAPDLWANAPPELKAAHDAQVRALESAQTEHARRSIEGRIASYTRRLKERAEAAAQQPATAPDEPAADPLADLAAEYPEIAKPLQEKLAPISDKLSQFDAQMRSRQEAADQQMDAELQANEALLETEHPGWTKYLNEHGAVFGAWIVDQPLYLRQAFVTNQEAIIDPYAAIETLDAFKTFVDANTQPPPHGSAPAAVQQQGLNPRRAAQLAGSASPQGRASRPTPSGIPQDGDPEQIWKAFADIDPDERKYRNA